MQLRRRADDRQHSVFLQFRDHEHPGTHRVQDYLVEHTTANPTLEDLARLAGMSERNLTRRFRETTGLSPKEYAHRIKLEVAHWLLQDTRLSVEAVASRCGFQDARQHGSCPSVWRTASQRQ